MLRMMTVGLLTLLVSVCGLSCAVPPPADGGDGGGNGGGDGGGGGGGGMAEFVGALSVNSSRTFSELADTESLAASAIFTSTEEVDNGNVDTKTIGDCLVTTVAINTDEPVDIPNFDQLDAGQSGTVSTTAQEATLDKQAEGLYGTGDLGEDGFTTGETYTFEFAGGIDIAAFMTSIGLPSGFTSTTPDLSDDDLTIDKSAALDVAWAPSGSADSVTVHVSTANIDTFVTIICTFDDIGSATVPLAAMECLLDDSTSTTVSISRTNSEQIEVALTAGGSGTLFVTAQTGDARTIFAGSDTGGVDPCDFIPCPEGTTCNPNTFLCE